MNETVLKQNFMAAHPQAVSKYIQNYTQNLEDSGTIDGNNPEEVENAEANAHDYLNSLSLQELKNELQPFITNQENIMNENQHIVNFIKHVTSNDFNKANEALAAVVNEKIKQRIQAADNQLALASKK